MPTLTLEEALAWDPMIRALEEQEPVWEPGTAHGYHATTYGWLVGEVVRRISGKSLGTFFHDEFAVPLDLEFWIGLPDEQQARVAPLIQWGDGPRVGVADPGDGGADRPVHGTRHHARQGARWRRTTSSPTPRAASTTRRSAPRRSPPPTASPTPDRSPASTPGSPAPSKAGRPSPLLTEEQVAKASELQTSGPDKCLFFETTFGLGFFVASLFAPYGGERSFGHTGAGGSVGFTDPEHGIGFGYVMNKMMAGLNGDPRSGGPHQGGLRRHRRHPDLRVGLCLRSSVSLGRGGLAASPPSRPAGRRRR